LWYARRRQFEALKAKWQALDARPEKRNQVPTYKLRSSCFRLARLLWPSKLDYDRHVADLVTSARQ
jgi:hypothetical protein